MSEKNFRIKTPHAAVLVWNYNDRVGIPKGEEYDASGVDDLNGTEKDGGVAGGKDTDAVIVSTLSLVSISTSKSKSQPEGSFQLVLAPYKNWTSTLTAGSWCAIMMSNDKIQKGDLKRANPKLVKMFGRIESVRCETRMQEDGTRSTLYYVSGVDWGHIFNSSLYIDNLINEPNDPKNQGTTAAVAIRNALFGKNGSPMYFSVSQNLTNLIDIMGQTLAGYTDIEPKIGRLAKTVYDFTLPSSVNEFFQFKTRTGKPENGISKMLNLTVGSLRGPNEYDGVDIASGFIDPFSLQGSHTLWQILMENSNPTLNEMFCDMDWEFKKDSKGQQTATPILRLYNRMKPFSYKGFTAGTNNAGKLKSYFQNIKTHKIDKLDVIAVNAGTNWRDKFNFIEIKPQFQEFAVIANWYKKKAQLFDRKAFNREGFRPLIFDTKQFPTVKSGEGDVKSLSIDWNALVVWTQLLREWYFGTHRLLNGTVELQGSTEYIGVGNNIKFSADLLNPNPNINADTKAMNMNKNILAHVESVSHSFSVDQNGARSYRTQITFVRGIVVYDNNNLVGEGMLDQKATLLSQESDRNRKNVISTSDVTDPDPQRIEGT